MKKHTLKKRLPLIAATMLAAGAVVATSAPATQAAPDSRTGVEMFSSAIYGMVGTVHIKITNETNHDAQIWFNPALDGGHSRTIKPGMSYTVQGHSGSYGVNQTFVHVHTVNGSFRVEGNNMTVWKPQIKVEKISGKEWILSGTKTGSIKGQPDVGEQWGFDKGDNRYIVYRHADGYETSNNVKNFEVALKKIR